MYYSGYHLSQDNFEKLKPSFADNHIYDPGIWYALDANKAGELGVSNPDQYLVDNLKKPTDEKNKYIGIVNYYTGEVELLYFADVSKDIIDDVVDNSGSDHEHIPTVASCLEPSVCEICGLILTPAFGHEYNIEKATCTEDRKCIRCGYIIEKAIGHDYDTTVLSFDEKGHFNKCKRCDSKGNFVEHDRKYGINSTTDEWVHTVTCSECAWRNESEACTVEYMSLNLTQHRKICKFCSKYQDSDHDDIRYRYLNEDKHVVYCNTCKSDLYEESHIDVENPLGMCDECDGIFDIEKVPTLDVVEMKNIQDSAEDAYWAKAGDKLQLVFSTTVMLSEKPTVTIQGKTIKSDQIAMRDSLTYVVEFRTDEYDFEDGLLDVSISNIRSIWGIMGENVDRTTDNKYISYDKILPEYIYVPK